MNKHAWLIVVVASFSLGGCALFGGNQGNAPAGEGGAPQGLDLNNEALPQDQALAVDTTGLEPNRQQGQVSGFVTVQMNGDAFLTLATPSGYLLYFVAPTGETVGLVLPPEAGPGTYALNPYYAAFNENSEPAGYGAFFTQLQGEVPVEWANVTAGRLTLQSVSPMTGAYEFTALNDGGQEVTVTGTFNQVAPVAPPEG